MKITTLGALYVTALMLAASSVHAASISGQGTWESTLQGRDLDGNLTTAEAFYDTALNITWLADVSAAAGSVYDTYSPGTGLMNWSTANTWAAGLNPYDSGITGWRLPTTVDVGNDGATYTDPYQGVDYGYNIMTHSEISHMFYVTLGDKAYYTTSGYGPQVGWGLTNTGPFSNVWGFYYWSSTEFASNTSNAWVFYYGYGLQTSSNKTNRHTAWAVHAGDVGAAVVPVPAAVWLFGSGLLGLVGMSRKRRR